MNRFLVRIVSLILVPCLLVEPSLAAVPGTQRTWYGCPTSPSFTEQAMSFRPAAIRTAHMQSSMTPGKFRLIAGGMGPGLRMAVRPPDPERILLPIIETNLQSQNAPAQYAYGLIDVTDLARQSGVDRLTLEKFLGAYDWASYAKARPSGLIPVFVFSSGKRYRSYVPHIIQSLQLMERLGGITSIPRMISRTASGHWRKTLFRGIPNIDGTLADFNHNQWVMKRLQLDIRDGTQIQTQEAFVKALLAYDGRATNRELAAVLGMSESGTSHHSVLVPVELWNYNLERLGLPFIERTIQRKKKRVQDEILNGLERMGGFATATELAEFVGAGSGALAKWAAAINYDVINRARALAELFPLGLYRPRQDAWNELRLDSVSVLGNRRLRQLVDELRLDHRKRFGGENPGFGYRALVETTIPWLYVLLEERTDLTPSERIDFLDGILEHIFEVSERLDIHGDLATPFFRLAVPRALNVNRNRLITADLSTDAAKAMEQILRGNGSVRKFSFAEDSRYPFGPEEQQEYIRQAREKAREFEWPWASHKFIPPGTMSVMPWAIPLVLGIAFIISSIRMVVLLVTGQGFRRYQKKDASLTPPAEGKDAHLPTQFQGSQEKTITFHSENNLPRNPSDPDSVRDPDAYRVTVKHQGEIIAHADFSLMSDLSQAILHIPLSPIPELHTTSAAIFIIREYQRKGIGRALMSFIFQLCEQMGVAEFVVQGAPSHPFYSKLGMTHRYNADLDTYEWIYPLNSGKRMPTESRHLIAEAA